ncbi:hypothetical protein LINPERPRIM_LOCUS24682 [Linum perenne]
MAHNSGNGDQEQEKFQHRWTFRRPENDRDSLSNDSSSSRSNGEEPLSLNMPNKEAAPSHNVVVLDDDDDAEEDGSKIRKKGKRGRRTTRKDSVARNKRVTTAAHNNDASNASELVQLNQLMNYMSSLLDEMREERGDMLICLKKGLKQIVADEVASQLEKRKCSCSLQLQQNQQQKPLSCEITKEKKPSDHAYNNSSNLPIENPKSHSMAIVPVTDSITRSPSAQEHQEEEEKQPEIVLGLKADNDHSSTRSRRGKRVAESSNNNNNPYQVPEDRDGGRRLGLGLGLRLRFEPGLSYNNHTSSKYLPLPTRVPTIAPTRAPTGQLDPSSFNNGQASRVQSSGTYMGYYQRLLQSDDSSSSSSSRAFITPMGSREVSYLRENRSPMAGRGFQTGFHHNAEGGSSSIPARGESRQFPAGLRIAAGGIRFTGGSGSGSNSMQIPSNFHGAYRSDNGRNMTFPDGFQFQK